MNINTLKIVSIWISVIFLVSGCTSTGSEQDLFTETNIENTPEAIENELRLAQAAEQERQLDKALIHYLKILEVDNTNASLLHKVGEIQTELGKYQLAVRAFEGVLALDPNYIPSLTQLGIYKLEQKKTSDANQLLERAIHLDQQRLGNAVVATEKYIPLDNSSPVEAYTTYGVVNDIEGKHDLARNMFMLALQLQEDSPLILTNLGYSHYLSNNYILAELYYKQAIDVNPKFERAWVNLGLIYVRNGTYNRAFQTFKQVMSEADAYNDIGYFLMLEGRYSEAEHFLLNAIELSPTYFEKANANLANVRLYIEESQNK